MLSELQVENLGVIESLTLGLHPGLTAVTGETGAGKTLFVGAIQLLVGGRADSDLVRAGADEARVHGRFEIDDAEIVLTRVVPAEGRSRAYVDGAPATAAVLGERASDLVEMHGQHDHQSLLSPATQRDSLDVFGGIDTAPVVAATKRVTQVESQLRDLGGDPQARQREADMLRHQSAEIAAAGISGPDEDDDLAREEALLSDATALREAVAALVGKEPLADLEARARDLSAQVDDLSLDLAARAEALVDDPERLEEVLARRRLLADLRRKYGDSLAEVLRFGEQAGERLAILDSAEERAAQLDEELQKARAELRTALDVLAEARRKAAPRLAAAMQAALRELALPRAEIEISVEGEGGRDVEILLGANVGEPARSLTKVASGGELSRTMLALRLVLSGESTAAGSADVDRLSRTIVFDEVDAGVGGAAAVAVGRALAEVASRHQVLVVTHLPQVAAFADHQVVVEKSAEAQRTVTRAREVTGEDRVVELSRMLSGRPDSESARRHAAELLENATGEIGR